MCQLSTITCTRCGDKEEVYKPCLMFRVNNPKGTVLDARGFADCEWKTQYNEQSNAGCAECLRRSLGAATVIVKDIDLFQQLLGLGANPFDKSAILIASLCHDVSFIMELFRVYEHTRPRRRGFATEALKEAIRRADLQTIKLFAKRADIN
ncbi:hypothetical protein BU16DRAFT_560853 [Lophium mytilinum]|uniref:Uncharacterized protein n=1 Tax=Lophium mytilinum TaxID=390894 RepID=A0A6A6QUB2_9PEZI|nr:hypothetical protein BU16DRAFT_560853 [Lophium mytilinum]